MSRLSMESRHRYFWFVSIIVAATFLMCGSGVDASATLHLLMVRFDNPTATKENGRRCDPFFLAHCDHIFKFSLDRGNSNDDPRTHHYWTYTTGHYADLHVIVFGRHMAGVDNPIISNFTTWPSIGVKFKVVVTDKDTGIFGDGDDNVDGFVQLLQLTPARNASVANWTRIHMLGIRNTEHKTSLTMDYKLYCYDNYYTSDCSVHCVASDSDAAGHYTCDPITGHIVCRPGWEDEATRCKRLSDDCLNHTCQNGATCVDGVRMHTCLCPPGYAGVRCETDIDECASNPCEHGGTCVDQVNGFRCSCPFGYTGKLCTESGYHQPAGSYNTSSTPRQRAVIIDTSSGETTPAWIYVLIAVICLILLGVMVLIAFLYSRRRKAANVSATPRPIIFHRSPDPLPTPQPAPFSPPPYAAAAAESSFCFATENVSVEEECNKTNNKLSNEKSTADDSPQNDDSGRSAYNYTYESIDDVTTGSTKL